MSLNNALLLAYQKESDELLIINKKGAIKH